ncbi:calreticulin-like [Capsicum annuum]|uniref:calreticulin-like n=1 Tax=Capsicum annuum TaxID=4072 RepID=UPI001FB0EBA3|nr:calreticulin-like [Capsicum annuum]
MITFNQYTDEVKNNVLDGLTKESKWVTVLTSNEDSDDGDLGGNPVGVRIGDDASTSTSKDAVGTSSPEHLHKHVAMLKEAEKKEDEEAVADEKEGEQSENKAATADIEKKRDDAEDEKEEPADEEEGELKEEKEEADQKDVVMNIVDKINVVRI